MSAGIRGAQGTIGPRGLESHLGIPGSGLAYRTKHNKKGKKGAAKSEETGTEESEWTEEEEAEIEKAANIMVGCCVAFVLGLVVWFFVWIGSAVDFTDYERGTTTVNRMMDDPVLAAAYTACSLPEAPPLCIRGLIEKHRIARVRE